MSASGSHVTKAVTVVELLKRRVPVSERYKGVACTCMYGIDQWEQKMITSLDWSIQQLHVHSNHQN